MTRTGQGALVAQMALEACGLFPETSQDSSSCGTATCFGQLKKPPKKMTTSKGNTGELCLLTEPCVSLVRNRCPGQLPVSCTSWREAQQVWIGVAGSPATVAKRSCDGPEQGKLCDAPPPRFHCHCLWQRCVASSWQRTVGNVTLQVAVEWAVACDNWPCLGAKPATHHPPDLEHVFTMHIQKLISETAHSD